MTPATRHVDAATALVGSPMSSSPGIPTKPRIAGFTKMMYAMTMKVVTPAAVSRRIVVPFSLKRKNRSRVLPPPGAAIELIEPPSLRPLNWRAEPTASGGRVARGDSAAREERDRLAGIELLDRAEPRGREGAAEPLRRGRERRAG